MIINGTIDVQVLKLYAWEKSFQQRILEIREEELRVLKKSQYLNAGSAIAFFTAPFLVSTFSSIYFNLVGQCDIAYLLFANMTFKREV